MRDSNNFKIYGQKCCCVEREMSIEVGAQLSADEGFK
jgi:hypothetical protein